MGLFYRIRSFFKTTENLASLPSFNLIMEQEHFDALALMKPKHVK